MFPSSLSIEGAAMRAALLADLAALPDVEVASTADPALDVPTPSGARVLPPVNGADGTFRRLVEQADAVWVIAPETHGILDSLTAVVEQADRAVLGCGAAVIRRVSNKPWLARHLAARGISVPPPPGDTWPVVVKPVRGAGCAGVSLARTRAEVATAKAGIREATGGAALAQTYVHGVPASVSLVSDGRRAVPLAVNAQHVCAGKPFIYHGGETPLRHPLADRAVQRALAVCDAVPGLVGHIGVDVVLTDDDAVVIEVNPRLTTSYVGLRDTLDVSVAALVLAASAGVLPAAAPSARGRARFSAAGSIESIDAGPLDAPPSGPHSARRRSSHP